VRSIADDLRRETVERVKALAPAERIRLAIRLAERDAASYARARGLSLDEAREALARQRRRGRRPSACAGHDA